MGLHVAQAGIVIGINKGQMNLEVEKAEAGVGGKKILEGASWLQLTLPGEPRQGFSGPAHMGSEGLRGVLDKLLGYAAQDSLLLRSNPESRSLVCITHHVSLLTPCSSS